LEFFLRAYISWVFGAAWIPQPTTPLSINTPKCKQSQINSLINLLSSSQRPLILFGSQAVCPPIEPNMLAEAVKVTLFFYIKLKIILDIRNTCLFGWNVERFIGGQFSSSNGP